MSLHLAGFKIGLSKNLHKLLLLDRIISPERIQCILCFTMCLDHLWYVKSEGMPECVKVLQATLWWPASRWQKSLRASKNVPFVLRRWSIYDWGRLRSAMCRRISRPAVVPTGFSWLGLQSLNLVSCTLGICARIVVQRKIDGLDLNNSTSSFSTISGTKICSRIKSYNVFS